MTRNFEEIFRAYDRDATLRQIKVVNAIFAQVNNLKTPDIRIQGQGIARDLNLHFIVDKHPAI